MELRLGNIDRCRKIYAKFLESHPTNPKGWSKFVDLEVSVGELTRARALCEMAIGNEDLEMPELLWKRYIDLEIEEENAEGARAQGPERERGARDAAGAPDQDREGVRRRELARGGGEAPAAREAQAPGRGRRRRGPGLRGVHRVRLPRGRQGGAGQAQDPAE